MVVRNLRQTPAWRALSPVAQSQYPWLRLEWHGVDNNNNGKICLSVRQAAERLGVSYNTAAKGFRELQAKGFIAVTHPPKLGTSGVASSPLFELTEISLPTAQGESGRRLYKQWSKGSDFPVVKAPVHNPTGKGGKTKPCLKNCDETAVNFATRKTEATQ
jgi:predicted transcriptional regulator